MIENSGVISDFIFVVIDQWFPSRVKHPELQIIRHNYSSLFRAKVYEEGFPIMQSLCGIFYTVYPNNAQIYSNPIFDVNLNSSDGKPYVIVREHWIDTVVWSIDKFLGYAPRKIIAILPRLGYPEKEIFHPLQSRDDFCKKILTGKVCFDEIYFVKP